MTHLDWVIVAGLMVVVFGFAGARARKTRTNVDWFLGGRSLPFWMVGVSMFATSVDGGEYVAMNGATYQDGLVMISGLVFGIGVGGVVAAFLVVPSMYRTGLITNAEYLEGRYDPSLRVISALVQIQYRTSTLATVAVALHLIFTEVAHLDSQAAWFLVVIVAAGTSLYSAWGGLKTVAAADLLLSAMMLTAIVVLWLAIWREVGGLQGATEALVRQEGAGQAETLLRMGGQRAGRSPAVVVVIGWCLIATGYFVVNHTQTMKMFGARSLWDMKMSVVVGSGLIILSGYFSSTLGIFGRALLPGLAQPDVIYPRLVDQYLGSGVKGVVVAGVIASAVSTFEGIGAALSAVFTRDIYGRFLVTGAREAHYLAVSRAATILIVAVSFAYVPFILGSSNIIDFFVRITSVFVTPLMTVYLMGALTRVHRRSGLVGLIAGSIYGLAASNLGGGADVPGLLPFWFTERFAAYSWSMGITAAAMLATSLLWGWTKDAQQVIRPSGWLAPSQQALPENISSPFAIRGQRVPWWAQPALSAALLLTLSGIMVFGVLW